MRTLVAFSVLTLISAPAVAQPQPSQPEVRIPAELTDPAMADRLGRMMGTLARAMMDLPVGEIQAAAEGREPTAADRRRTVRDVAGNDPDFERKVEQQVAVQVPRMQAGMKAMARSMPAMIAAMENVANEMEREIDRATANLPQPGYPRQ